jgi:hypothetical protein
MLYEMLTGQLPMGRFEPPSRCVPVDARIDDVVMRALERAPAQRWQSAAEVGRAITTIAGSKNPGRRPWVASTAVLISALVALAFTSFMEGRSPMNPEAAQGLSGIDAWWGSLTTVLQIFYIIAFLGTGVALVESVLMLLGVGMHDLPSADIPHDPSLNAHASGLQALSLQTITAFLTGFGWGGVVTLTSGGSVMLAVAVALIGGFILARTLLYLMSSMYRLAHDGTLNYDNAVGQVGTVYVTIPPRNTAGGQIEIMLQGRMAVASAITKGDAPIRPGAKVRVTELADRSTLFVTPL